MFLQVSVCPWGACMVAGGACVRGWGGVVAGGHAWLWGGGMCGGSGACVGYNEIRSMSGRYASYWNALLLGFNYTHTYSKTSAIWSLYWAVPLIAENFMLPNNFYSSFGQFINFKVMKVTHTD